MRRETHCNVQGKAEQQAAKREAKREAQGGKMRRGVIVATAAVLLIVIDQWIKVAVKTGMCLHESLRITDWFYISYIENNGMAYGISLGSKLFLSLFRLTAIGALTYYICRQVCQRARWRYLVCLTMVLAGAVGNLIDCMFYGLIFSGASPFYASYLVPFGTGYAPFLMGKVVDMFYFPLIVTHYPLWMPIVGGQQFVFFSPVFNFADATICVGMALLLLLCRKELAALDLNLKRRWRKSA